jgi:hypothetical protein
MQFEQKERGPEVLGSEIKTKENKLGNLAKKLESKIGLGVVALLLTTTAMAEKCAPEVDLTPQKLKNRWAEINKINEENAKKPPLSEQLARTSSIKKMTVENGEIKFEPLKIEVKKPEVPSTKPEIQLAEKKVIEKKGFPG